MPTSIQPPGSGVWAASPAKTGAEGAGFKFMNVSRVGCNWGVLGTRVLRTGGVRVGELGVLVCGFMTRRMCSNRKVSPLEAEKKIVDPTPSHRKRP